MRFHPLRWLRPFELVTYGLALAIALFLRLNNLRMGWKTVEYTLSSVVPMSYKVLFIGLVLQAGAHLLGGRPVRAWWRAVTTRESAGLWVRLFLVMIAQNYGYTWLKTCVPLLRRTLLDPALWHLDRALHFGVSPSILLVELVQGTPFARGLDFWYDIWIFTVLVVCAFVLLSDDLAKRRNFALACSLMWLAGAWIYLALPAVGPCFTVPEVFAGIRAEIPGATLGQSRLWHNYGLMLAGRDGSLREFNPYFGIAAMPSLHVGAHWLFMLWSRRYARRLVPIFAAATLLTLLGSIATGWHYAIDGYAGMLLAWGAVRLADRLEPVAAPPAEEGAPSPPVPPPAALSGATSPLP